MRRSIIPLCALTATLCGCGAGSAAGGGAGERQALANACAKAWKLAASAQAGLRAAAQVHASGNAELPRAIVEKIGEPAGEASAAWTTASEAARSLGDGSLASLTARSAAEYSEVQFDLSPEGGGYEATAKVLDQAAVANGRVARAARERGLSACAGPAG